MRLWDTISKKEVNSFVDHNDTVNSVKFHPDGTCVASGGMDCKIKVIYYLILIQTIFHSYGIWGLWN